MDFTGKHELHVGDTVTTAEHEKIEVIHIANGMPWKYAGITGEGDVVQLNTDKTIFDKTQPQPYKRWRAEKGDSYYNVCDNGNDAIYETGDGYDNTQHATGNYFKTEAEAETHKQRLLATQELKDLAEGYEFKRDENHAIYYDFIDGDFNVKCWSFMQNGATYFSTKAKAQHAIDTLGETKLKTIFGVK